MVNLISFTLGSFLIYLKVLLISAKLISSTTSIICAQNDRLVPLACLKNMYIGGGSSSSVLLNHLLILVGTELKIRVNLLNSLMMEHIPRSLDNLKNFSNLTTIKLCLGEFQSRVKLIGPGGRVSMVPTAYRNDRTDLHLNLSPSSTPRRLNGSNRPRKYHLRRFCLPGTPSYNRLTHSHAF